MVAKTKTNAEFSIQPERDSATKEVRWVTITATWDGVRRYQASFRKKLGTNGRKELDRPYNRIRFDEKGEFEASNIVIPASVKGEMMRLAAGVIFG